VKRAVEDWLKDGLDGRTERIKTLYTGLMGLLNERIGARPLSSLSAGDVWWALQQLAPRSSRRSLQITRSCLEHAVRQAHADDLLGRAVASLVNCAAGRPDTDTALRYGRSFVWTGRSCERAIGDRDSAIAQPRASVAMPITARGCPPRSRLGTRSARPGTSAAATFSLVRTREAFLTRAAS
jgi:hypothetical protein